MTSDDTGIFQPHAGLFDPGPPMFDQTHMHAATVTPTQHEILTHVAELGSISPIEAGTILHRARGHCGQGAKGGPGDGRACCPYASSDGLEAIKRLIKRGKLARIDKGVYAMASGVVVVPKVPVEDPADAAREEAIDRVDRGMDAEWRERALAELEALCRERTGKGWAGTFTSDDLRERMGDDEPREPRAYGAIMRRGRFLGFCNPLDSWRTSDRVSNHKRPERVWITRL